MTMFSSFIQLDMEWQSQGLLILEDTLLESDSTEKTWRSFRVEPRI